MDAHDTPAGMATVSFLAARAALSTMDAAGRHKHPGTTGHSAPQLALRALLMLRHLRAEITSWQSGLIETVRGSGVIWADLAEPPGVPYSPAATCYAAPPPAHDPCRDHRVR